MTYLDHAAGSPVDPGVLAEMVAWWSPDRVGNPSSPHAAGRRARDGLETARERVATCLAARPREVVFTSGGTESNALAILGSWGSSRKPRERDRIVVSPYEHPSVRRAVEACAAQGARVGELGGAPEGRVDPGDLERLLGPDVFLVSVMGASNETGCLQPIEDLAGIAADRGIPFHCDASQVPARVDLAAWVAGADLVTVSAHKVYGPCGVGALVIRGRAAPGPLLPGGTHERGFRPGTPSVALATGLAACLERAQAAGTREREHLTGLDDRLRDRLAGASGWRVVGPEEPWPRGARAPGLMTLLSPDLDAETVLMALDLEGFQVGLGAACASGAREPSPGLSAMGLSDRDQRRTLRISLGKDTTPAEVDGFSAALLAISGRLRECRR